MESGVCQQMCVKMKGAEMDCDQVNGKNKPVRWQNKGKERGKEERQMNGRGVEGPWQAQGEGERKLLGLDRIGLLVGRRGGLPLLGCEHPPPCPG